LINPVIDCDVNHNIDSIIDDFGGSFENKTTLIKLLVKNEQVDKSVIVDSHEISILVHLSLHFLMSIGLQFDHNPTTFPEMTGVFFSKSILVFIIALAYLMESLLGKD
jgi:hypothetical protein